MNIEEIAMELVGNAGESRSLAFEALNAAKKGDYEEAEKKIQESKEKMLRAHHIQTELICKEADGEKVELGLIMVHAQDHLMTAILARDLITEMIEVYKKIK